MNSVSVGVSENEDESIVFKCQEIDIKFFSFSGITERF